MDPIFKYLPRIMLIVLDDEVLNKYIFEIGKYMVFIYLFYAIIE